MTLLSEALMLNFWLLFWLGLFFGIYPKFLKKNNNFMAHFTKKFVAAWDLTLVWSKISNDAIKTQFFPTSPLCLPHRLISASDSLSPHGGKMAAAPGAWLYSHVQQRGNAFPVVSTSPESHLICPAWGTYHQDLGLGARENVTEQWTAPRSARKSYELIQVRCPIKTSVCTR